MVTNQGRGETRMVRTNNPLLLDSAQIYFGNCQAGHSFSHSYYRTMHSTDVVIREEN